jgi:predicted TIM-barrel fold metal-dependent hydrolase
MAQTGYVSADSHVIEPADLWTTRIERRFRDRAPHVVSEHGGVKGDFFVCENLPPFDVSGFALAGIDPREFRAHGNRGYPGVRPGAWDPTARLADMEADGVVGEVIYTSLGLALHSIEDGALRAASFRAYNDWLAEFCARDPRRFAGVALVAMDEVSDAVAELERSARLGLKGALIWGVPPAERRYNQPLWDPLWAAAQDLGIPLSLHILTARRSTDIEMDHPMLSYPFLPDGIRRSLADLIYGGVLERFPRLRLVSAENDVGWIPHFVQRLDHAWERYRFVDRAALLPERPSFYFRRQIYATFQEDAVGVQARHLVGLESFMWGSDYPHSDSTWPHSREAIERDFAGVPDEDRRRMTHDTCARLYGLG